MTAACGRDDGNNTASNNTATEADADQDTNTADEACELTDGATFTEDQIGVGDGTDDTLTCTLNGQNPLILGYTNCDDGTDLYVTGEGEANDPDDPSGWIVLTEGSGTWHDGPWQEAWATCYGY